MSLDSSTVGNHVRYVRMSLDSSTVGNHVRYVCLSLEPGVGRSNKLNLFLTMLVLYIFFLFGVESYVCLRSKC